MGREQGDFPRLRRIAIHRRPAAGNAWGRSRGAGRLRERQAGDTHHQVLLHAFTGMSMTNARAARARNALRVGSCLVGSRDAGCDAMAMATRALRGRCRRPADGFSLVLPWSPERSDSPLRLLAAVRVAQDAAQWAARLDAVAERVKPGKQVRFSERSITAARAGTSPSTRPPSPAGTRRRHRRSRASPRFRAGCG